MRHQDKRRFRRLAFKTKVAFVIGTRLLLADLVDISATGCRLRIEDDRPVKGPVTPSFQVARLEVAARRIWRRGNEAGFRFVYTQVEPDAPLLDERTESAAA